MSEKIKLTRYQAEAIESGLKVADNRKRDILKAHMQVQGSLVGALEPLNELAFDNLVEALYIGYEVEPEFKLNDFITNVRTGVTMKLDNEERVDFVNHRYCDKGNVRLATKIEAEHEERKITDKKLDKLLLDLNSEERIRLYRKLDCRLDIEVE